MKIYYRPSLDNCFCIGLCVVLVCHHCQTSVLQRFIPFIFSCNLVLRCCIKHTFPVSISLNIFVSLCHSLHLFLLQFGCVEYKHQHTHTIILSFYLSLSIMFPSSVAVTVTLPNSFSFPIKFIFYTGKFSRISTKINVK